MLATEKEKRKAQELLAKIYETKYASLVRCATYGLYGTPLGDIGRAEDIVQEAAIIALNKPAQFCNSENPTGWLMNTVSNVVRNTRSRDMHIAKCLLDAQRYCDGFSTDSHDLELIFDGIVEPSELAILKKVYLDGYKYREMEAELDMNPSAFAMYLKRIKSKFIKNYFLKSEKTADSEHSKIGGFQHAKS